MLLERPDPAQIVLQISACNNDGTPKTELELAEVRVYHIANNIEVVDLSWVAATQVASSNVWRYIWEPTALPTGQYSIQFHLRDPSNADFVGLEDLVVQDLAVQADIEFLKKVARGRWKIDTVFNTMVFYDDDGLTPLMTFRLKDANGVPAAINVFERVLE